MKFQTRRQQLQHRIMLISMALIFVAVLLVAAGLVVYTVATRLL